MALGSSYFCVLEDFLGTTSPTSLSPASILLLTQLQARELVPTLLYFCVVLWEEAEDLPDATLALMLLMTELPTRTSLRFCVARLTSVISPNMGKSFAMSNLLG
jgi:hypothetical protein